MKHEKLISDLTAFISAQNIKNTKVETDLKLPKNSLSNFLSGKKELPEKWVTPISNYILGLGDLSTKVTTADKIQISGNAKTVAHPNDLHIEENVSKIDTAWFQEILDYCDKANCEPADLILAHKTRLKVTPIEKEKSRVIVQDKTTGTYDPMNNPLYKHKMGIK